MDKYVCGVMGKQSMPFFNRRKGGADVVVAVDSQPGNNVKTGTDQMAAVENRACYDLHPALSA